jgi:hypothetical protein
MSARRNRTVRALVAREAFLRERASVRVAAERALANGFAIDPSRRREADRAMMHYALFRRIPRALRGSVIPVSRTFLELHTAHLGDPWVMWELARTR